MIDYNLEIGNIKEKKRQAVEKLDDMLTSLSEVIKFEKSSKGFETGGDYSSQIVEDLMKVEDEVQEIADRLNFMTLGIAEDDDLPF